MIRRQEETPQANVRIIISIIISVYTMIHYFYYRDDGWFHIYIANGFLMWSIFLYVLAKKSETQEPLLEWYRFLGIISDNLMLTVGFYFGEQISGPLFLVYLWVAFGNGIRFGSKYLMTSASLAFVGFTCLIFISPYWGSPEHIYTSYGLAVSLLVLPMYVMRLLKQITQALETVQIANEAKQNFIANMNHELRTPLTSIIQACSLLKKRNEKSENMDLLNIVSNSAKHQLDIVNQILNFSKVSSNKVEHSEEAINLHTVIKNVKDIITPNCKAKGLELNVYIDCRISPNVIGNDIMIKQILLNLCGNAVKFTEQGSVSIIAKYKDSDLNNQHIEIQVMDTGIGIEDKIKDKIFEPFNQGNDSITRKYGGTGLGITISKEYAIFMGGDLELDNTQKVGSKFIFTLNNKLNRFETQQFKDTSYQIFTLGFDSLEIEQNTFLNKPNVVSISVDDRTMAESIMNDTSLKDLGHVALLANIDKKSALERSSLYPDFKNKLTFFGYSNNDLSELDNSLLENFKTIIQGSKNSDYLNNALGIFEEFYEVTDSRRPEDITNAFINEKLDILMVEDTEAIRKTMRYIIEDHGHHLTACTNGFEGLDKLEDNQYDVVIVDLHMPGMTGIEMVKNFKLLNPDDNTAFVLMTADSLTNNIEVDEFFDGVGTKPIMPSALLEIVYESYKSKKKSSPHNIEVKNPDNLTTDDSTPETTDALDNTINNTTVLFDESYITEMLKCTTEKDFKDLMDTYSKDSFIYIDSLEIAIRENEIVEVRNLFHVLEGASGSVGAIGIGQYIKSMKKKSPSELASEGHKIITRLRLLNSYAVKRLYSIANSSFSNDGQSPVDKTTILH